VRDHPPGGTSERTSETYFTATDAGDDTDSATVSDVFQIPNLRSKTTRRLEWVHGGAAPSRADFGLSSLILRYSRAESS